MYVIKDNVIKLSVRGLVEFICRSGDIDNRTGGFSDVRLMQEGTRMHKKIQKSMGASYRAEVPLKIELPETVENIDYIIRLEGRADGISVISTKKWTAVRHRLERFLLMRLKPCSPMWKS